MNSTLIWHSCHTISLPMEIQLGNVTVHLSDPENFRHFYRRFSIIFTGHPSSSPPLEMLGVHINFTIHVCDPEIRVSFTNKHGF